MEDEPWVLGRLLDVACGAGNFAAELAGEVAGVTQIVGVDTQASALEAAARTLADLPHTLHRMDGAHLEFGDGVFDTVAIAHSLHHLPDPAVVLAEMVRVLRPGGRFVVQEMIRDTPDGPWRTHVELHHWWAAIDRRRGVYHQPTWPRAAILATLEALPGIHWQWQDLQDNTSDPFDPRIPAQLDPVIDRYLALCDASPEGRALADHGSRLRRMLSTNGFRSAPAVRAVGVKQA